MRSVGSAIRTAAVAAAGLVLLAGCGGGTSGGERGQGDGAGQGKRPGGQAHASATTHLRNVPGVGATLRARIPSGSRQVVAVYGKGADSADSTVVLYEKGAKGWDQKGSWQAHNGRHGWSVDHHEGDKRSPVGVFTLTDAGGVLADPGARLPYTHTAAFTPPAYWSKNTRHDFDYVVAVNYNRVKGASPLDPARPEGESKGGGIWLHMDHGSGTSGCVSISKSGMATLLRSLDPARHPVVVMGDRAHLAK
ncbi:L,D-transpeptidase family protein [Streptomyces sp. NPDC050161]|uniref:L,D-transpeptidase family protein n=1 Tax=Streptomyces sp. NPDC050161 TaxID=3365604 RepID=UPI0037912246